MIDKAICFIIPNFEHKDSDNCGIFVIIAVIFRKVYQYSRIFRKKFEKHANFHEKVVTLTLFEVEDRLHLGKTQIKFGFSLDLHYLCIVILKRVTRKGALSCA